jgi:hypothetical protein
MLSCKALTQLHASDYLDHALTPRARFGVRVHLVLCRNCRRFISQLQVIREVLRRNPPPTGDLQVQATAAQLHRAYHEQKKSLPLL